MDINWEEQKDENGELKALRRKFEFKDFASALEFINKVGAIAEEHNHHPDMTLGWGYAWVLTRSHDVNGVTDRDYKLANAIDGLL